MTRGFPDAPCSLQPSGPRDEESPTPGLDLGSARVGGGRWTSAEVLTPAASGEARQGKLFIPLPGLGVPSSPLGLLFPLDRVSPSVLITSPARGLWGPVEDVGSLKVRGEFGAVEARGLGAAPGAPGFTCSLIRGR